LTNKKVKTQWEKNKNTVGEKQKHNGRETKTQWERESAPIVFCIFKNETLMKHR